MKKKIGFILLLAVCLAGCGKNDTSETSTATPEKKVEENKQEESKQEEQSEFDSKAEFNDLKIGDTVCVETAGPEDKLQYKLTLNSIEYSEGSINGMDGEGDDFIIADITLEGIGPDISYGVILTQLYFGRSTELVPEQQASYGLNTFADADEFLSEGESVTGKVAARYDKGDLTLEKRGMSTTKYVYNVSESEIKDYVQGEQ